MNPNAVARQGMNSNDYVRPPRPAITSVNSTPRLPGAPITNAVATTAMNSLDDVRPHAPGQTTRELHAPGAGRTFLTREECYD